jgi:hypothetical protein
VQVGDLIKYGHSRYSDGDDVTGVVLWVNKEGGTVKVLDKFGNIDWFVTSYCEVLSESR